jgi:hypothetical protein
MEHHLSWLRLLVQDEKGTTVLTTSRCFLLKNARNAINASRCGVCKPQIFFKTSGLYQKTANEQLAVTQFNKMCTYDALPVYHNCPSPTHLWQHVPVHLCVTTTVAPAGYKGEGWRENKMTKVEAGKHEKSTI